MSKSDFMVYVAENIGDNPEKGRKYVGKTNDLRRRALRHRAEAKNGSRCLFHMAIRKFGIDAFEFKPDRTGMFEWEAYDHEVELIAHLDTFHGDGYNMSEGGDGDWGSTRVATAEELEKRIKEMNKLHLDPEFRMKMNAALGIPVIVGFKKYNSLAEAVKITGSTAKSLKKRIRMGMPGYTFDLDRIWSKDEIKSCILPKQRLDSCTPLIADFKKFRSMREAERKLKTSRGKIKHRLDNGYPGYSLDLNKTWDEEERRLMQESGNKSRVAYRPIIAEFKKFITMKDAEKEIGVSNHTIKNRIEKGVPGYSYDLNRTWTEEEINEWKSKYHSGDKIPVMVNFVPYISIQKAIEQTGICRATINRRIRNCVPGYAKTINKCYFGNTPLTWRFNMKAKDFEYYELDENDRPIRQFHRMSPVIQFADDQSNRF